MKIFIMLLTCLHLILSISESRVLRVGQAYEYASLTLAANNAVPGDTIMIFDSPIAQSSYISNLRGTPDKPIVISSGLEDYVHFTGGGTAIQLSNAANIILTKLSFQGQSNNGVNIDDGGDFSTPAENITFYDCKWLGMGATGNNDNLKMSGVVNFVIKKCYFNNGAAGGSHIDMVGCHDGTIEENEFRNGGSNSIQAKGGTSSIIIARNLFINAGLRAINIGGSTGSEYFRPLDAPAESDGIIIFSNIFFGSMAPIAYVGTINSKVINNTIVNPDKWAIRILRENQNPYLQFDNNNQFINNIVYIGNSASSATINIGPGTVPDAYIFRNNLWYNHESPSWANPNLPVAEFNGLRGINPHIDNILDSNLTPNLNSPVVSAGYPNDYAIYDYYGNKFNNPPSIGAIEVNVPNSVKSYSNANVKVFPNPSDNYLIIDFSESDNFNIEIIDITGKIVYNNNFVGSEVTINISNLPNGIYLIRLYTVGKTVKQLFIINR